LIADDDADLTMTFRAVMEDSNNDVDANKRIEVYTSNAFAADHDNGFQVVSELLYFKSLIMQR
jgi:hypothetical protein